MASLYVFRDSDGLKKRGELAEFHDPNRHDGLIPVIIDDGFPGAKEVRWLRIEDIMEEI